jgi:hypothetical protein
MLPEEERPLTLPKSAIADRRVSQLSTMPEGLLDGYGMGEAAALFAFLQRGPAPAGN